MAGSALSVVTSAEFSEHAAETTDAHDASAISVVPFETIQATDVQAALEEIFNEAEGGGGGSGDAIDISITDAANDFTADNVEDALAELQADAEADAAALAAHLADGSDAHDASAISIADSGNDFAATDVEGALAELQADNEAHLADTSGAHAASAISIVDAANDFTATDVEGALAELQADLEAVTGGTGLSDHLADTTDAHDASAISILDTANDFTATNVEAALAELQSDAEAHLADTVDAHDASAISIADAGGFYDSTTVEGALQEVAQDNVFGSAFFAYVATCLEPLAIEAFQRDSFTYVVPTNTTKLVMDAGNTHLGASGRWEIRKASHPFTPLRGNTLRGASTGAHAVILNPTAGTYADSRQTYLDRLFELYETTNKYLALTAPSTGFLLLPGPYGSILTSVSNFDFTGVWLQPFTGYEVNLMNEVGDTGNTDYQRVGNPILIPFSKNICAKVVTGAERVAGAGRGAVTWINCPDDWGAVTDPNAPYDFRDDFMDASLDTGSTWTRTQSTTGNVEIDTLYNWLKLRGSGAWGANGLFSQSSFSKISGRVLEVDVYVAASNPGIIVGFHDGAGNAQTDFAHGVIFGTASGVNRLTVQENGNDRGVVGPAPGYSAGNIYRVRISLTSGTACTYQIQGGPEHPVIGGSTWTTLSPAVNASSTTPVRVGAAVLGVNDNYISDPRLYS